MNPIKTLKDTWNRVACYIDGSGVSPLFSSSAVDEEMKQRGWKVEYNLLAMAAVRYPASAAVFTTVTNPRGERVTNAAQFKEYHAARHAVARKVYGLDAA